MVDSDGLGSKTALAFAPTSGPWAQLADTAFHSPSLMGDDEETVRWEMVDEE